MIYPPNDVAGFGQWLIDHNACAEARTWAQGKDLKTVWATCERGDWMEWLLDACGYKWTATAWAEYQRVKAQTIREIIGNPFRRKMTSATSPQHKEPTN